MMTNMQKRAKAGGERGANGEWYDGGRFINTIPENHKVRGSSNRGSGKQEIAPYTWEVAPQGKRSLYRQFSGVFGKVVNGIAIFTASEQTLQYFKTTREEAQAMIDAWNGGARWIE